MSKKAIKGFLVGYDNDERYRIYVKERGKVILSRDVRFYERTQNCNPRAELELRRNDIGIAKTEESADEDVPETEDHVNNEDGKEDEGRMNKEERQKQEKKLRDRATIKPPVYLEDYIMYTEDLSDNPANYEEAMKSNLYEEWKHAMNSEMNSLKENKTWTLTDLPRGVKTVSCKWVYCIKRNADGTINKYKARLVARGFTQRKGVDYGETFSPVARLCTIRAVLSIAAKEHMVLEQFDVSTAFLYGELEEDIYMNQPDGYSDGTNRVCKLQKSLYGLKQAPRCWNKRIGSILKHLGFTACDADPCLYVNEKEGRKMLLVLYVDDGLCAANDEKDLQQFLQSLKAELKIVTRKADYFLGLEIERRGEEIKICQRAHAKKILEKFNFTECKPVSTPMEKSSECSMTGKAINELKFPYRQAVGSLMYLMVASRPDLAFSVGFLSRTLENPSKENVVRLKRVFRYLKGTLNFGIVYGRNRENNFLECFSDADYGGCLKTGRSTTGVVVMHAGGIISWISQRQPTVATSTTEAELIAASEATKEIIWLSKLFNQISPLEHLPDLRVDNSAAIRLAQNPEFHRRTKHIAIRHFFIREKLSERQLEVHYIPSEEQVADIMTKPLSKIRLNKLRTYMGILSD